MSGLDIFAIIVLLILIVAAVAIWIALAMLPGKIAAKRNHPQAEAINIGGWLGAIFGGVFWPIILVWAFTKPTVPASAAEQGEVQALSDRVAVLEKQRAQVGGTT
jgi:amino acid transporter